MQHLRKQPSVSFKTVGCRLNQSETARIAAQFTEAGYKVVQFGEDCDVAVIHSCAVTRNAETDTMRLARGAKRMPCSPFVIIAGCAAELSGRDIAAATGADMIAPQSEKFSLPRLLGNRFGPARSTTGNIQTIPLHDTIRAPVKVQDGCNFGCAYCVVPATRGKPASRPVEEIVEEVKGLADAGYREIVLTGANLGCYEDGARRLAHLIQTVEKVAGVKRIRLSSIELTTGEKDVIALMANSGKLCRHLHVPLQSGDDKILRSMGRRYSADEFRRFMDYALDKVGAMGIGTDIIAGFPGEDDASFENTMKLIEELPLSYMHVFSYSKRPGTRAAEMDEQVPAAKKKARSHILRNIAQKKKDSFARGFINQTVNVLIEETDDSGTSSGWTGEYVRASIPCVSLPPNSIVSATVESATNGVLRLAEIAEA